jgi:hypothetical protein
MVHFLRNRVVYFGGVERHEDFASKKRLHNKLIQRFGMVVDNAEFNNAQSEFNTNSCGSGY